MPSPAELPVFESQVTRREFVFGPLKKAGAIYLASQLTPLLAACGESDSLETLAQHFGLEVVRWQFEEEEEIVYFLAEVKDPNDIFLAGLSPNRLIIHALYEGSLAPVKVFEGAPCDVLGEEWVKDEIFNAESYKGLCEKILPIAKRPLVEIIANNPPKIPDAIFEVIQDGGIVQDEETLLRNGRRHMTSPEAIPFLLSSKTPSIPRRIVGQIPESENKLNFRPGDILVDFRGKPWYLQNGGRYEIHSSTREFVEKRHKKMKIFQVPPWVIDKIPKKEMPGRFFEDQYGRLIDGQSSRLLVFWGGLGSTSDSTKKFFERAVERFLAIGGKETQILFGTYRMGVIKDGFVPGLYDESDSLGYPPTSIDEANNLYTWLKLKAPLAQVVSCGQSQGGVVCFYAALAHPGIHSRIITINAPLTGVDRISVSAGPFEFEDLAFFKGCESWPIDDKCEAIRHYVAEGDNPTLRGNVENWAKLILDNGIEIFNFSATQDPLVKTERAILENSTHSINGKKIQQVWDVPTAMTGYSSPHGGILSHEPFLAELVRVIGRP